MNNGAKATPYESTLPYDSSLNSTGFDTNSSIPSNFSTDSFAFLTPVSIFSLNSLVPFANLLLPLYAVFTALLNLLIASFIFLELSFNLYNPLVKFSIPFFNLDIPVFNPLTPFTIFLPCVRPLESLVTNCLAPAFNLSEESFILFAPHF